MFCGQYPSGRGLEKYIDICVNSFHLSILCTRITIFGDRYLIRWSSLFHLTYDMIYDTVLHTWSLLVYALDYWPKQKLELHFFLKFTPSPDKNCSLICLYITMYKNSSWNFFSELGVKDPNSKYKGDIDLINRCPWQGYTFVTFRLYCKTRPSTQTFKNGNFLKGHKTRSMKWFSLFVISRILWLVQNAILRSIYSCRQSDIPWISVDLRMSRTNWWITMVVVPLRSDRPLQTRIKALHVI